MKVELIIDNVYNMASFWQLEPDEIFKRGYLVH